MTTQSQKPDDGEVERPGGSSAQTQRGEAFLDLVLSKWRLDGYVGAMEGERVPGTGNNRTCAKPTGHEKLGCFPGTASSW